MGLFKNILSNMVAVERRGFDPFNETYSEKMKEVEESEFKIGETASQLTPDQRQAMEEIVRQTGRDVGGFSSIYTQTEGGGYLLDEEKVGRLFESSEETGYVLNIDKKAMDSVRKDRGRYVTSLPPGSEKGFPKTYYKKSSAAYDPLTGKIASPGQENISDFLVREAVKRGDAQIKNILRETPEKEFKKYGVEKSSILRQYGIE
jgi:hypothetical protein